MTAVMKRELRAYFKSPIGYVFLFLFLVATGAIFCVYNVGNGITNVEYYFQTCCYILIVAVPLLTMRSFSDDRRTKTDQILLTAPISITKMVLGKFFAAYLMFIISLVPTLLNMGFLEIHGNLSWSMVWGNYFGLLLVGAAYIAISMLMSAFTESNIVAFMLGMFALLFFALCQMLLNFVYTEWLYDIISFISVTIRFSNFSTGLFDFSAILYFLSLTVLFLFIIIRIIDKRRWS